MLSKRTQVLVALLGSSNDGEALNACRALARALKAEGMDWHDLARGVRTVREPPPRSPPPPPPGAGPHHAVVKALMAKGRERFKPREWEFLESLLRWHGAPTEKQAAWLADLKRREGV